MTLYDDRPEPGQDGSVRKAHYGPGRQPWDDAVDAGWGAHGAGLMVLRYLRRDKMPEHSLESARWYFRQLKDHASGLHDRRDVHDWQRTLSRLIIMLTLEEIALLETRP